ncbi:MAG: ABC transporter substrate-binding protein [Chromatiales bacterium]|nr:ABC transporter substrate-binding protein [Chromatiales bacterium]
MNPGGSRHGAGVVLAWMGLLLCLLLSACGQAKRDELRFGLASMPVTLDPRYATDAASTRIIRLLYQRLVEFDDSAMPRPGLAHWEEISPTHYRFTLDVPRATFSDGSALTAADVKASFDSVLDPATASPHRISFANIAAIEISGADIIDFHLQRADPLFPGRLGLGIMPAAAISRGYAFNRASLGSGAFEVLAWPSDGELQLRRRSDGVGLGFVLVPDPTVRVLKVLRGEIDMLQNELPPELVAYLRGRDEVRVSQSAGSTFAYIGFNLRDAVTSQLAVRQAVAHAIDRAAIIRYVLDDTARLGGSILPPEHWAGVTGLDGFSYDPALSRQLLTKLGYEAPGSLKIVYKTSTDPVRVRIATVIQRQLKEVGIDVELRSYDWGTFYGDIKAGNFQMYSLSWVGVKLPEIFRYVFHSSSLPPSGANRGFFVSPAADRLIDDVEAAPDLAHQLEPLHALQRQLIDELPYVPLWYEDQIFVARAGISGYRIASDGNYDSLAEVTRVSP